MVGGGVVLVVVVMVVRVVRVIRLMLLQQDIALGIYVQSTGFCVKQPGVLLEVGQIQCVIVVITERLRLKLETAFVFAGKGVAVDIVS